jgi:hypothetical protein
MMPRVSSFPKKEMRSSRRRTIWATMPLAPMMSREILRLNILIFKFITSILILCKVGGDEREIGRWGNKEMGRWGSRVMG